jgi:hypothetical protein
MVGRIGFGLKDGTEAQQDGTKYLQDGFEDWRSVHVFIVRLLNPYPLSDVDHQAVALPGGSDHERD